MALARRLSSLGRAARSEAGIKVRQPLARALVHLPPGSPTPPAGRGRGRAQRRRGRGRSASSATSSPTSWSPTSRCSGPRLGTRGPGSSVPPWARSTAPPPTAALAAGQPVVVELDDGPVELGRRRDRAAGQVPAGLRGLPRRRRGGRPRPHPRRRPAPAWAGPRGDPPRAGPAQGERSRGVRLDRPAPGRPRRPRARCSTLVGREVLARSVSTSPPAGDGGPAPTRRARRRRDEPRGSTDLGGSRRDRRRGQRRRPEGRRRTCSPSTSGPVARRWRWCPPPVASWPMPPSRSPSTCSDGGGAEQDPDEWWSAICSATRRAVAGSLGAVRAGLIGVGCTAQWSGTVAVGADG